MSTEETNDKDFEEIPDLSLPTEVPQEPTVATGPLEYTPPAPPRETKADLEYEAEMERVFAPPKPYSATFLPEEKESRGFVSTGVRTAIQAPLKAGIRFSGNVMGPAMGYSLKLTDAAYEGIFGEGGVPDDWHQFLTKGVTDEDVNGILRSIGMEPEGLIENVGSEAGAVAIGAAAVVYGAGVVGVGRVLTSVAPTIAPKVAFLGTWLSGAIGSGITGPSGSTVAMGADWALGTKFQEWIDNESTAAQRFALQSLEDILMGAAVRVGARAAKATFGAVVDKVLKPAWDTVRGDYDGAMSILTRLDAEKKARAVAPIDTSAPTVVAQYGVVAPKDIKEVDGFIKNLTNYVKDYPNDFQAQINLEEALRMKAGELPFNMQRFDKYSTSKLLTLKATKALDAAASGIQEKAEVPVAELNGYINRITRLLEQDPKNKDLIKVLDKGINMVHGRTPVDLTQLSDYTIANINLRRAEAQMQKSLKALGETPVAGATPKVELPMEIPPVDLTEVSPETRAILDKIGKPTEEVLSEATPKVTVDPAAREVAEAELLKQKLLSTSGITTTAKTPSGVTKAAKQKPKAKTVEQLEAPVKAKAPTLSQSTQAGKRAEVRNETYTTPNFVAVGKHGGYIAETPMDADIASIFSKKSDPTVADSEYLQATYDMTLAQASKYYNKHIKKAITQVSAASASGVKKTFDTTTGELLDKGREEYLRANIKEASKVPKLPKSSQGSTISFEESPVLQTLGNSLPTVINTVVSNPLIAVATTMAGEYFGLTPDLDTEDYALIVAASMGINVAKDFLGKQQLKASRSLYESIKANHAVASSEFVSTLLGLSENTKNLIVGNLGDDLSNKMIDMVDQVFSNNYLGRATWSTTNSNFNVLAGATESAIQNGSARGVATNIPPEAFLDPTVLRAYISDVTVSTVESAKGITLTPQGVSRINERYTAWMHQWKVSDEGQKWLSYLTNDTPEGRQVVLAVFDSIETKALDIIEKVAKESPDGVLTHQGATQLHQALGALNATIDILKNPATQLGATSPGIEQFTRGLFMSAFPDIMVDGAKGSKYFTKYRETLQSAFNKISFWLDQGKLVDGNRADFFKYISEDITKPTTITDVIKDFMFQSMLSSPVTTTKAFKSNLLGTTAVLAKKGLKTVAAIATGDEREIISSKIAFANFRGAIRNAIDLMKKTAEGNTKAFDGMFDRPFNQTMGISSELFGGGREETSTFVRAYQKLGEYMGVSPKSMMRAVDVFAQVLNRSILEGEQLGKELFDAVDNGETLEAAMERLTTTEAVAARTAMVANDARSIIGLTPTTVPRVRSGVVTQELGVFGKMSGATQEAARKWPVISLYKPMTTTAANMWQAGVEHSPIGYLAEILHPNSVFNVSEEALARMGAAERRLVLDGRKEIRARAVTGFIMGMALLEAFEVSGEYFVTPAARGDTKLKSVVGDPKGNIVTVTADGRKTSDNTFDLLRASLLFITGSLKAGEGGDYGGLLMDSLIEAVTPDVWAEVIETAHRVKNAGGQGAETLGQLLGELTMEIGQRFTDPALLRWVRTTQQGFLDKPDGLFGHEKREYLTGEPYATEGASPRSFVSGQVTKVPLSALSLSLAESGVDITKSPEFSWKGLPVDNPLLARALKNSFYRLIRSEDFGGGNTIISRLQQIASPELRKGEAKKFLEDAKNEALRMLTPDLDKYHFERINK